MCRLLYFRNLNTGIKKIDNNRIKLLLIRFLTIAMGTKGMNIICLMAFFAKKGLPPEEPMFKWIISDQFQTNLKQDSLIENLA